MRRPLALIVPALLALAACTPLDAMNRMGTTTETEPFPTGYKDLVRHHYGLNRGPDLQISEPRPLLAANAFDPARWYVCVRSGAGSAAIHVISRGRLEGTGGIPVPANATSADPSLCDGVTYQPLG